jgi:hypothetical protein
MERIEQKDKHGFKLKAEQRKGLFIILGRKRDWKTRRAREEFRRPAFEGTVLEPGCKLKKID